MAKSIVKSNPSAASATIKLGEAQRQLLSAAALRDDRCLTRPTSVRGVQFARLSKSLIEAGYAREVRARAPSPVWRREGDTGTAFALKLTAAGIKATAAADVPKDAASKARLPQAEVTKGAVGKARLPQAKAEAGSEDNATAAKQDTTDFAKPTAARVFATGKPRAEKPSSPRARVHGEPRSTSKIAAVIGLLSRAEGATLAELVAATDWLPHTTRAALTGLRKRGYAVSLDRTNRQRGSVYRIAARPDPVALAPSEIAAEAA